MKRVGSILLGVSVWAMAGGCTSIKIPDVDFFKLPEYKEAKKDAAYPEAGDAPSAPMDKRSKAAWDSAAQTLIDTRDNFNAPSGGGPERSPEDIQREYDALKAKIDEYKIDDPQ